MLYELCGPLQLWPWKVNIGVIATLPVIALVPGFVALKAFTVLLPLATKPMAVLELVQLYEVPDPLIGVAGTATWWQ